MSLAQSFGRLRVALQSALGASTDQPSRTVTFREPDTGANGRPLADRLVRSVLADLRQSEAARHVRFEVACQAGLEVRGDPLRFQTVLAALARHAVTQTPSGRVLVTCLHRAGRLQLAVADDGVGQDRAVQESELRAIKEQLALQGGSLEIVSQAGEGSLLRASWPDVRTDKTEPSTAAEPETSVRPAVRVLPELASHSG